MESAPFDPGSFIRPASGSSPRGPRSALNSRPGQRGDNPGYLSTAGNVTFPPLAHTREIDLGHNGFFGTAWAALGMTAYYLALVWINTLLGLFLSPLFLIPMTWLQDRYLARRNRTRGSAEPVPATTTVVRPTATPAAR